ncbi:replicative DNA helicase [Aquimarina sp. 2201CG14-23]|uniref:replicative DNA helicase n=1 Tax=Aquimarina mycalae TaxID=3040073 RepID=UPI002477EC05|nr:replicative DNA helicase [Aquimarina sp. 2201CG14-23]MDH7444660.1 replicative DNA helicase [Aquimarina sp. 2201CG14-23]
MIKSLEIPKAIDIEESILAAMLVDERGAIEAVPILKEVDMFFKPEHQEIYKAILNLYKNSNPIDLVTVSDEVKSNSNSNKILSVVMDLMQSSGSAAHIEYHCRLLVQFWIKRRIIKKCNVLISNAYKKDYDSLQLLEDDAKYNDEIQETILSGSHSITYADALSQTEKRVKMLSSMEEGQIDGVPTGYPKIDKFTGGWQNSDLIIIAARPGMGKTSLILKTVVECGKNDRPIAFFSLEMSAQQLSARTISINSHFHLRQLIRDGFEKPEYFVTLRSKTEEMKKYPVYIDDTPALDISDLVAKARIWKRKHNIEIIVVDYLQLVTDHSKSGNREQEISSISRNLKKLAKELDVPVIALSQLSRSVETRGGDKRPRLSDLRESGAIEQDADIVTFIYRPEYYGCEVDEELLAMNANAELSFAKYRAGSLETKGLYWDANKTKYMDPIDRDSDDNVDNFNIPNGNPDVAF